MLHERRFKPSVVVTRAWRLEDLATVPANSFFLLRQHMSISTVSGQSRRVPGDKGIEEEGVEYRSWFDLPRVSLTCLADRQEGGRAQADDVTDLRG